MPCFPVASAGLLQCLYTSNIRKHVISVLAQQFNQVVGSRRFNPHQSLSHTCSWMRSKVMTTRVVKPWLINDVSHSDTCSYNEISILSVSFSDNPQIQTHWMWDPVCFAKCVCVSVYVCVNVLEKELVLGGLWHQRRCLNDSFDVWALGAWDTLILHY